MIECPPRRKCPDHPAHGSRAHDDPEQPTEGVSSKVFSYDRPPQRDRSSESRTEEKKKGEDQPSHLEIGKRERSHAEEAECRGEDIPFVEKIAQPTEAQPADEAE